MSELVFVLKDMNEMFYLDKKEFKYERNRFCTGSLESPNVNTSLKSFADLKRHEYISTISHGKLMRLIEISGILNDFGWSTEMYSKEYEKGMKLIDEAHSIVELLETEENKKLESNTKLSKMKNVGFSLSKKEIVDFRNFLDVKAFDTDIIIRVFEDIESFRDDLLEDVFPFELDGSDEVKMTNNEIEVDNIIKNKENIFETSEGQIIEFNSDWKNE